MLLFAIIFFSLSVLCSSLFVFLLSIQVETIDETEEIKYKQLGKVQLILFWRRGALPSCLGSQIVGGVLVIGTS